VMGMCLSVREDISGTAHASFTKFFVHVAYMSVVRSSSGTFTIGRIAYRREVFFPIENALSAGKGGCECTARAKYRPVLSTIALIVISAVPYVLYVPELGPLLVLL